MSIHCCSFHFLTPFPDAFSVFGGVYLFFLLSATKLHFSPAFSYILALAMTRALSGIGLPPSLRTHTRRTRCPLSSPCPYRASFLASCAQFLLLCSPGSPGLFLHKSTVGPVGPTVHLHIKTSPPLWAAWKNHFLFIGSVVYWVRRAPFYGKKVILL